MYTLKQIKAFKDGAKQVLMTKPDLGDHGLCNALRCLPRHDIWFSSYDLVGKLFGTINYPSGLERGAYTPHRQTMLMLICTLSAKELLEIVNREDEDEE